MTRHCSRVLLISPSPCGSFVAIAVLIRVMFFIFQIREKVVSTASLPHIEFLSVLSGFLWWVISFPHAWFGQRKSFPCAAQGLRSPCAQKLPLKDRYKFSKRKLCP